MVLELRISPSCRDVKKFKGEKEGARTIARIKYLRVWNLRKIVINPSSGNGTMRVRRKVGRGERGKKGARKRGTSTQGKERQSRNMRGLKGGLRFVNVLHPFSLRDLIKCWHEPQTWTRKNWREKQRENEMESVRRRKRELKREKVLNLSSDKFESWLNLEIFWNSF